jgi:hypothetical protein
MLKLWSRSFEPDQQAVVKATSFCSEMAQALLARPSAPRAVLMYSPPEPWLANLLAGASTHIDVRNFAPARLRRLHRRIGEPAFRLHAMSYPQAAAMSWACEMTALVDAAEDAAAGQTLLLDFERLLARPQGMLGQVFAHFGQVVAPEEIAAIVAGPVMARYAKATEHAYDAGLRARVLAETRAERGREIAEGLAWLEQAARAYPAIAGALEAAAD